MLLSSALLLASCTMKNPQQADARDAGCDTLTLGKLKREVLGKEIGKLPVYRCYVSRDTSLEGDEGVQWKGKAYYRDSQLVFLAEATWDDPKQIHRITVLGPQIREGELFVNRQFKDIRGIVSDKVPSSPDGYLFLRYKEDTAVSIQLDISGAASDSPLSRGVSGLDKIPDTLKVESIVIL